jgi:hypothetical protein
MNNTGKAHGDLLGLMKSLARRSSNCFFNSNYSFGAIRYGLL